MQIALAPMEGLVDNILRDVLTRVGGIDWCVTEFIRINDQLLTPAYFHKFGPELLTGARTASGVPLRVQLLGSDPVCLAENAALACELGSEVIDLNFGCPAKTVNKSRGGAVLLNEPELLNRIVEHVRRAVPAHIVVHARTKTDGYKPPAHWEWIPRVQEVVNVPVFANGDIWSVEDWQRCREVSGAEHIMLGRGLVARPDLALQIAAARAGEEVVEMTWAHMQPMLHEFWRQSVAQLTEKQAPGRLKQWLAMLTRNYPQAVELFTAMRRETDLQQVSRLLGMSHPVLQH